MELAHWTRKFRNNISVGARSTDSSINVMWIVLVATPQSTISDRGGGGEEGRRQWTCLVAQFNIH
ncbi:hypothetical protein E2C01_078627 [Portunus trituberculatus]|uniref:Uncharacterized protein n=1 Tax=Portunus trituberculatus TaxID=210409 RepID=A0A5B7IQN8_PORTR|nr:hypothetical protein [Portunus trituberculatus]